jgi:two-component system response regulator FixJ
MAPNATVFVIDDDPGVRGLLDAELSSAGLCVRLFSSAEDFLAQYTERDRGCLLLDLHLSGMSGVELLQTLCVRRLTLPVIIITGYGDVSNAVHAMKLGAMDLIQKPFGHEELLAKVRAALARDAATCQKLAEIEAARQRLKLLTPRERELLVALADGKSSKRIAQDLGLSPKTVENHRAHLLAKTQAQNVADLVRLSMLAAFP